MPGSSLAASGSGMIGDRVPSKSKHSATWSACAPAGRVLGGRGVGGHWCTLPLTEAGMVFVVRDR